MSDDKSKVQVVETLKLEKFDGDDQTQEPIETIEILTINGIEISRRVTRKEEGNAAN